MANLLSDRSGSIGHFYSLGAGGSRKKSNAFSPEMDASLLRYLGQKSLGGLSALGNFLDVPGSMARDALAGENPFDQLLSPFSDAGRTTGRGLLEKYGMLGQNQSGFDWGDVAGVGAEILTDPTNWVTLGGKTAVGKLAEKAGTLSKGLAPALTKGERALATINIPLMPTRNPLLELGTGAKAAKVGEKVDKVYDFARYSAPGRFLAKNLDATNLGRSTKEGQQLAQEIFPEMEKARQAELLTTIEQAKALEDAGLNKSKDMATMRKLVEGVEPISSDVTGVAAAQRTANEELAKVRREYGFSDRLLKDDLIDYGARHSLGKPGDVRVQNAIFNLNNPKTISRFDIFRGFKQGTEGVNDLMRDTGIWNMGRAMKNAKQSRKDTIDAIAMGIEQNHGGNIERFFPRLDAKGNPLLNSKGAPVMRDRYKGLATWMYNNLDRADELEKTGLYGNVLADSHGYRSSMRERQAIADQLFPKIAKASQDIADYDPKKYMTIGEFIKRGSNGMIVAREDADGIYGAVPKMMEMIGASPATLDDAKAFSKRVIPRDLGEDLSNVWEATKAPKDLNAVMDGIKRYTSLFKAGVLTHPARYVRDLMGATVRNLEEGALSGKSLKEGAGLATGYDPATLVDHPLVKDYLSKKGITNPTTKQAADAARVLYTSYVPGATIYSEAGDAAAAADPTLEGILSHLPGRGYSGVKSVAKDIGSTFAGRRPDASWNPFRISGVMGDETKFGPVKAGELAGDVIDKVGRLPAWLELTRQGWDASAAAKKVGQFQTDYSARNFTPIERQWLKNLIPFYSFQKTQLGHVLDDLVQSQGGSRLGNIIKGTARQSSEDPYIPDHIRQASSIRLPDKGDTRSYLTSFGLMHEDPASLLGTLGTMNTRGATLEALSMLNPLIKWIPEWGMGRTAFQQGPRGGRDLEDLDPTIGRIMSNISDSITGERTKRPDPFISPGTEFFFGNLPTSRWMTTLRTLSDPRKNLLEKLLNTTSGVKVSDVSPGMMDRVKTEYVDQLMRDMNAREFEQLYFNDEQTAAMSPEDQLRAKLLESIRSKISEQQRARAK